MSRPGVNPRVLEETFQRALKAHSAGRRDEAAALYRQLLAVAPRAAAPLLFLGLAEIQSGDPGGLQRMEAALRLEPRNAGFLQNYAAALLDLGRIDDADRAYRRCLGLTPAALDAHLGRGNIARLRH
jgi:Flp pilus assembly protein TadD